MLHSIARGNEVIYNINDLIPQEKAMRPIPLHEFVERAGTQKAAGDLLGIAQCTISLALKAERKFYVVPDEKGGWTYYLVRDRKNPNPRAATPSARRLPPGLAPPGG